MLCKNSKVIDNIVSLITIAFQKLLDDKRFSQLVIFLTKILKWSIYLQYIHELLLVDAPTLIFLSCWNHPFVMIFDKRTET